MKIGVALFKKGEMAGSFFIAGMDKAESFYGKNDLPSGVIWLTNLDFMGIRKVGLDNHANYRMDGFFRATMKSLMKEADVEDEDSESRAAEYLGKLADATMDIFYQNLNYEGKTLDTLAQTIAAATKVKGRKSSDSRSVEEALRNAKQTYQRCSGEKVFGGKWYGVRFPRCEYAQDMLHVPLPVGKWSKGSEPWLWVRTNIDKIPSICMVEVSKCPSEQVANLFSFGFSTRKNEGREWATSHEVLFLKEVLGCSVTISHTLVAEAFIEPPLQLEWGHETSLSVSQGLYAENLWKSLTVEDTAHAAWITSMDRIACSKMALAIDNAGFKVDGFGTGTAQAVIRSGEYESFLEFCLEHNYVLPLNFMRHLEIEG